MSTSPKTRRGRSTDLQKREEIVLAATKAFFDHGYAAASIEAIAADAGVSKVTVYNHFGDKRGLFAAAVEHECENIRGQLLFDDAGNGIRERLLAFGHSMIAFLSRPEMIRFEQRIAAEVEQEPELGLCFLEAGPRRMKLALASLLEREQERGTLILDDPLQAAEHLAAMCKGLADMERRFAGRVDAVAADRRIRSAVDLFLKGYGKREDQGAPAAS
ncbi:TetR/AcrR family transcriptional regulator [Sphingomonas sp. LHG3406-1]|uniref:TetR/AcrR family transcriptional regulator n=1 Tax=Sphingomonas sp. LHG3406-1 TaxID=2804617 RepID=UPI002636EAA7|nr:TetR/AcrR family transcriptional regulator [Sphingomonas sp. LHG3406-1]